MDVTIITTGPMMHRAPPPLFFASNCALPLSPLPYFLASILPMVQAVARKLCPAVIGLLIVIATRDKQALFIGCGACEGARLCRTEIEITYTHTLAPVCVYMFHIFSRYQTPFVLEFLMRSSYLESLWMLHTRHLWYCEILWKRTHFWSNNIFHGVSEWELRSMLLLRRDND